MVSDPKPSYQRAWVACASARNRLANKLSYRALVTAVAALCSIFAHSDLGASPRASPSGSAEGAPSSLASSTFVRVAKLTASDGAGPNAFGIDVAMSGNTAIIGSENPSGSALEKYPYVFDRGVGPSIWLEVDKLTTYNPGPQFASVALSGDTAVIATAPEDAQVFERDLGSGLWLETAVLDTGFGPADIVTVAMSGDSVVIGRQFVDLDGVVHAGVAFIFERDPESGLWGEGIQLVPSEAGEGYRFGNAVGISGDTAVVSAHKANSGGIERGALFVFERDAGGPGLWGEVAKLTASDAMDDHRLGGNMVISGDTIVTNSNRTIEAVYVFERTLEAGGQWTEVSRLTASDSPNNSYFGSSVGLTAGRIVVGDSFQESFTGAAYVFERTSEGDWVEVGKLTLPTGVPEDRFGIEVAIEGETIMIGAPQNFINGGIPGAVYVFEKALFVDGFESGDTQAWSSSSMP